MNRLIIVWCLLCFGFSSSAQENHLDKKITIAFDTIKRENALAKINDISGVGFVYNDFPQLEQTVSGTYKNETLRYVLTRCFAGTGLAFKEIGDNITIYASNKDDGGQSTTQSRTPKNFTMSGYVYDKTSGEILIGCSVFEKNTLKGTTTNEYGFYSLTLLQGNNSIAVSYLGYDTHEMTQDIEQNTKKDFYLEQSPFELAEVELKADRSPIQKAEVSVIRLTPDKISKIPALLGEPDIQQAILSLAGVSSVGEGTTGFNVRGGKVDQNLVLIDEASLYNMSHMFGFITVVNNSAVKDVKFYKAGIPAKYGGRVSSVLDIRLKDGNNRKFSGALSLNPISSKIGIEVPIIKDKLNVSFFGRRSFVDLFLPLFLDDSDGKQRAGFHDATLKVSYKLGKNDKILLSAFSGRDFLTYEPNDSDNEGQKDVFKWGDQLASLRWNHIFSDKVFSNLTLITSNYNFSFETKNGLFTNTDTPLKVNSSINALEGKFDFSYYPMPFLSIYTGLGAKNSKFTRLHQQESTNSAITKPKDFGLEYYGYIDTESKLTKNLKVRAGLRFSGLWNHGPNFVYEYDPLLPPSISTVVGVERIGANKTVANFNNFEPRLSLNYQLNSKNALKFAYDRTAQYIHLLSNTNGVAPFDVWSPANSFLRPTLGNQYTIGYATSPTGFNASVDVFYKELENLVEFRENADLFLANQKETLVVPAKAEAYGVEVSVEKNIGKLQGYMNYTWSRSQVRTVSEWESIQINEGNPYPTNYDRPHNFNLALTYPISKRMVLSSKFTYQSGRPITLPQGRIGNLIIYSDRNAYRLPVNHRLDLSLTIGPKPDSRKKIKGEWVISVLNAYARKNTFSYFVSAKRNRSTFGEPDTYQLKKISVLGSLIPTFSYNIKF